MNTLNLLQDWWQFLSGIGVSAGAMIAWIIRTRRYTRKLKEDNNKAAQESEDILYDMLEEMKVKIIKQAGQQIKTAEALAEKETMLIKLKENCPKCYKKVIDGN